MPEVPCSHERVMINGVQLHCAVAGEGPLVLLLHGFPECWYSWRHQIPALAAAGYKVVAPDLRGYNESDKPASGYDINTLVRDILGLMDHYGSEKAVVAGHDWGGAVAWHTALQFPARVDRLIALNLPHPALLARALRHNWRQQLRSCYILFFQLPWAPEWVIRRRNYAAIEKAFRGTAVHPERFTNEDIEVYKAAARKPGALTAMLNYYRALKPAQIYAWSRPGFLSRLDVPTLMIWGEKDIALGKELTYGTEELVSDLVIRYVPTSSHWVQQDEPEIVTRTMLSFLPRQWAG